MNKKEREKNENESTGGCAVRARLGSGWWGVAVGGARALKASTPWLFSPTCSALLLLSPYVGFFLLPLHLLPWTSETTNLTQCVVGVEPFNSKIGGWGLEGSDREQWRQVAPSGDGQNVNWERESQWLELSSNQLGQNVAL